MCRRRGRRQGSAMNSLRSPLTPPPARGRSRVSKIVLDAADDIIDAPAAVGSAITLEVGQGRFAWLIRTHSDLSTENLTLALYNG